MPKLFKFDNWEFLVEMARTPRKCPILDFRPLYKTSNFKDILYLGGREVTPMQGLKQGNLRFDHPDFGGMTIRLNLNGAIWEDPRREEGTNRGADALEMDQEAEIYMVAPKANRDGKAIQIMQNSYPSGKYFQPCLTIEDFELRLEFIIKRILYKKKFFTREEAFSDDSPNTIIINKITNDIEELIKLEKLNAVPPSIGNDIIGFIAKAINDGKVLNYMKLIETLEKETPDIRAKLEDKGVDMVKAKKLSKGHDLLKRKSL